jgi:hypothetical protein
LGLVVGDNDIAIPHPYGVSSLNTNLPGGHGPEVNRGPKGGEQVEQHQAFVKQHGKKPDDQSDAKEKRGSYSDKGDKKNSNDSIQHF